MRRELHNFDIYPKTVPANETSRITIRPLGSHMAFAEGKSYTITVISMTEPVDYVESERYPTTTAAAAGGQLAFDWQFGREQEYVIRVTVNDQQQFVALSVYALERDLYDRLPLKGDLHVHSTYSDGAEAPEIVAANYRRAGYDFMVVSDHYEYGGSQAAIGFYRDVPIDLNIVPGEEVHAPKVETHIVNFGGDYSVNELYRQDEAKYFAEVRAIEEGLSIPPEAGRVKPFEYAACLWVYQKIREANGLSIFAHPNWTVEAYQIGDDMVRWQFANHAFDAYELIGGLSPKENNMQLAFYHTAKAQGLADFPIVGSSDSHGSVLARYEGSTIGSPVDNPYGFNEMKTIVFAYKNEKNDIIDAIRSGYSVAIDEYRGETPRVHGDYRLVSYALFLLGEYFPLHDELCFEEGRAMKAYAAGSEPEALDELAFLKGRVPRLMEKYFHK